MALVLALLALEPSAEVDRLGAVAAGRYHLESFGEPVGYLVAHATAEGGCARGPRDLQTGRC